MAEKPYNQPGQIIQPLEYVIPTAATATATAAPPKSLLCYGVSLCYGVHLLVKPNP